MTSERADSLERCGYEWRAPYLHPPQPPTWRPHEGFKGQVCAQPKGHDGPHRSLTNCITESSS